MKVAAIQMKAVLGDVAVNLKKARALAEAAIREGARWVILPEFFTTAAGFSKKNASWGHPPGRGGHGSFDIPCPDP